MIFWITLGVLALGIIGLILIDEWSDWHDASAFVTSIFGAAVVVMFIVMLINYCCAEPFVERMNVRYETLTYQYENNFYDNDNDVGKYELMQDIREWNEDLAAKKVAQHNFWYGIFVPDIYDQFEFIELE